MEVNRLTVSSTLGNSTATTTSVRWPTHPTINSTPRILEGNPLENQVTKGQQPEAPKYLGDTNPVVVQIEIKHHLRMQLICFEWRQVVSAAR